jgi:hypothetical protein
MELSWGTAIVGAFAAGLGLIEVSRRLSVYAKAPLSRALLVWPCRALGAVLIAISFLVVLWNVVGPLIIGLILNI